jgi:hypothetical protein
MYLQKVKSICYLCYDVRYNYVQNVLVLKSICYLCYDVRYNYVQNVPVPVLGDIRIFLIYSIYADPDTDPDPGSQTNADSGLVRLLSHKKLIFFTYKIYYK